MKLHIFAAIFSALVVGLGQILKGRVKKGVLLLLAFYFFLPAAAYVSLIVNPYLFLSVLGFSIISGIMLWTYGVADALLRK